MNSFTPQQYANGLSQPIFLSKTPKNHAGVVQDKGTPPRTGAASTQPAPSETPAYERTLRNNLQNSAHVPEHTPKRHGSQKRRTIQVYGCVPPHVADRLEHLRDQGANGQKVSLSAVVAALLTQGVQTHTDMQYGALFEPMIKKLFRTESQGRDARFASLLVKLAIDINQTKGILYNLLARQSGMTENTLKTIQIESRKNAIQNLKNRSPEILELIAEVREWMEENKKSNEG